MEPMRPAVSYAVFGAYMSEGNRRVSNRQVERLVRSYCFFSILSPVARHGKEVLPVARHGKEVLVRMLIETSRYAWAERERLGGDND